MARLVHIVRSKFEVLAPYKIAVNCTPVAAMPWLPLEDAILTALIKREDEKVELELPEKFAGLKLQEVKFGPLDFVVVKSELRVYEPTASTSSSSDAYYFGVMVNEKEGLGLLLQYMQVGDSRNNRKFPETSLHFHDNEAEVLYSLEGRAVLELFSKEGAKSATIPLGGQGCLAYTVPSGIGHRLRVAEGHSIVFIITSPVVAASQLGSTNRSHRYIKAC